jgi:hypothetical protein
MMSLLEKLSHISNLNQSQRNKKVQLPLLLDKNSIKLLRIQPRMFSLSTMLHGVDIAKSLLQFGMISLRLTLIIMTLSLLNSMLLPTKLKVLKLEDTQL